MNDDLGRVDILLAAPFIWPAEGPVTSEMGPWHPVGIDIGLDSDADSPIHAAARGTVSFAGGEAWEDLGLRVVIDHGGEMETVYGHLDSILVVENQKVAQGHVIGLGGNTGVSEGKHLHFVVHHGSFQIDPEHILPDPDSAEVLETAVDCSREAIVLDSGSPLLLKLDKSLQSGARIAGVDLERARVSEGALPAEAILLTSYSVLFDTTPTVVGTGEEDEYNLVIATIGADALEVRCTIFVRTFTVAPSFYVRPTNTPTPVPTWTMSPTPTPTYTPIPTPTPTPTPTKTPFALPR